MLTGPEDSEPNVGFGAQTDRQPLPCLPPYPVSSSPCDLRNPMRRQDKGRARKPQPAKRDRVRTRRSEPLAMTAHWVTVADKGGELTGYGGGRWLTESVNRRAPSAPTPALAGVWLGLSAGQRLAGESQAWSGLPNQTRAIRMPCRPCGPYGDYEAPDAGRHQGKICRVDVCAEQNEQHQCNRSAPDFHGHHCNAPMSACRAPSGA